MSVKRIGSAAIRYSQYNGYLYFSVEGSGIEFSTEIVEVPLRAAILSLVKPQAPERPNRIFEKPMYTSGPTFDKWKKEMEEFSSTDEYRQMANSYYTKLYEYNEKVRNFNKRINEITQEYIKELIKNNSIKPIRLYSEHGSTQKDYYYLNGNIYQFNRKGYSEEEILLQIMDLEHSERRYFERLKHKHTVAKHEESESKRTSIPEEIRIAVWRRDGGKCVKCGSQEKIEYDHIIPFSKGGSNTARNIQILCEKCNREKSDKIG